MQYFYSLLEDGVGDDGAGGGAVSGLFVGSLGGVDEELAADVFCLTIE